MRRAPRCSGPGSPTRPRPVRPPPSTVAANSSRIVKISMPQALVLFDIDGTLLRRAGPHHRDALVQAVRKATGLETTTDDVPVQGMLDRDIVTAMLSNAGASAGFTRRHMPGIVS